MRTSVRKHIILKFLELLYYLTLVNSDRNLPDFVFPNSWNLDDK